MNVKQFATTLLVLAAVAGLSACGSLSHNIADDGSSAEELVWPELDDTTPMHTDGTWPTLTSLRQIHPDMTKNQIMKLIGEPQFHEGAWAVHEWDYLFHLLDEKTGTYHICQYKVLFDRDMRAGSFYWKPEGCGNLVHPEEAQAEPTVLSIAALFAFDRSEFHAINAEGRSQLHRVVGELKKQVAEGSTLMVNGYTDPLGSDSYNRTLSQQRAETVRDYFIREGIPAAAIEAEGHGASSPVVDCNTAPSSQLVACLAPDRRIEVVVTPGD